MLTGTTSSFAGTVGILPQDDITPLGMHVSYLVDESSEMSLEQFTSDLYQRKLIASETETPSFGFSARALQLHFQHRRLKTYFFICIDCGAVVGVDIQIKIKHLL